MRASQAIYISVLAGFLTGCATAPVLQPARPAVAQSQQFALAHSDTVFKTDHITKILDSERSIIYMQNQGGGGVGLGLLLGPIGVAANANMIETKTSADVEKFKGKVNLDPATALGRAAANSQFALQDLISSQDVRMTPYILVSKTDESTLHISALILIESPVGAAKWERRYRYQLPGKYTSDELANIDAAKLASLQIDTVNAYGALLRHITEESDARIAHEAAITFVSPYLTPRFELQQRGSLIRTDGSRVWVRTTSGVTAIAPEDVTYKAL